MKKNQLLVILFALVSLTSLAINDFSLDGVLYSEFRTGKSVYVEGVDPSQKGKITAITIPGWVTYNGVTYNVEGIDVTAFYNEWALKTVSIGYGVKIIKDRAFASCGVKTITLPGSLTQIGSDIFDNTSIDNIYCPWLKIPEKIADDAFAGRSLANWKFTLPTQAMPAQLQVHPAFKSQSFTYEVNSTIAKDFTYNGLPYVITKASTSSSDGEAALVGQHTYAFTDLTLNNFSYAMPDYVLTKRTYHPTSIAECAFLGNTRITTLVVPGCYKDINAGAFRNCTALTSVNLGATVIHDYAFAGCTALKTIDFNTGVEDIAEYAFGTTYSPCPSIETINIGKDVKNAANVTTSGYSPLWHGANTTTITVADENPYFSSYSGVLYNKDFTKLFICPRNRTSFTYVDQSTKEIGSMAFYQFKGTRLVVNYGVSSIGAYAFYGSSLEFLKLPSTFKSSTRPNAFKQMTKLKELMFASALPPVTFESLDDFLGDPSIHENPLTIRVPINSITAYKNGGFKAVAEKYNIQGGAYDTMGKSATSDTYDLFFLQNDETQEATITFAYEATRNYKTENITGVVTIPATYFDYNGTTYTVTELSQNAFHNASKMTGVVLPKTLKKIGGAAFNTSGVNTEINLLECSQLEVVGLKAFLNNKIPSIILPRNNRITLLCKYAWYTEADKATKVYCDVKDYDYYYNMAYTWNDSDAKNAFNCNLNGYICPDESGQDVFGFPFNATFDSDAAEEFDLHTVTNYSVSGKSLTLGDVSSNSITGKNAYYYSSLKLKEGEQILKVNAIDETPSYEATNYLCFYSNLANRTAADEVPISSHYYDYYVYNKAKGGFELFDEVVLTEATPYLRTYKYYPPADFYPLGSIKGDVNGDGSVNTGDVSKLYEIILGNVVDQSIVDRANVNGDDSINTGDLSDLYKIILGTN